jgi:hypothetical protein
MTPCPPCFTQLVRDDLPILHARLLKQGRCRGFVRRELLGLTIYRGTRRSSRCLMINRYEIRKVIRVKWRTRPRLCYFRHSPAAWAKPFTRLFVICSSIPPLPLSKVLSPKPRDRSIWTCRTRDMGLYRVRSDVRGGGGISFRRFPRFIDAAAKRKRNH